MKVQTSIYVGEVLTRPFAEHAIGGLLIALEGECMEQGRVPTWTTLEIVPETAKYTALNGDVERYYYLTAYVETEEAD